MVQSIDIPDCAWSISLNTPVKKMKSIPFPLKDLVHFLPIYWRIQKDLKRLRKEGKEVVNVFRMSEGINDKGVPIGGLGSGSIGRGWRGEFNSWNIRAGIPHRATVYADQFSTWIKYSENGKKKTKAVVLSTITPPKKQLSSWKWPCNKLQGYYYALFPFAWTVYRDIIPGVHLVCKQFSPFIPHNYRESSYPIGIFEWLVINNRPEDISISILFSFQNGTGTDNDLEGGHYNSLFSSTKDVVGVKLHHIHRQFKPLSKRENIADKYYEDPLVFAIATHSSHETKVTWHTRFNPLGPGNEVWSTFKQTGELPNFTSDSPSSKGEAIAAAIASKITVKARDSSRLVFTLGWDAPLARFSSGKAYLRYYTKFFSLEGNAVEKLTLEALTNFQQWEQEINKWHQEIITASDYPNWLKSALLNELYYLIDGGSVWFLEPDDNKEDGHFLYLESSDYLMFNTYDVHFYASFALIQLFPKLELSIQRDFAQTVLNEDSELRTYYGSNTTALRKPKGSVPHDLGSPFEDPLVKVNAYNLWDVSQWKDLNPKFVLQVYRDYYLTKDIDFLKDVWPAVKSAVEYSLQFDTDSDGLIENAGFPDQTYDLWAVTGPSAYTGGLWLACLTAFCKLAEIMGEQETVERFKPILDRGRQRYTELLWNGTYFNYDSSSSKNSKSIMADQLCGLLYCFACDLEPYVNLDHAQTAVKTIYTFNVERFARANMGAINGMLPNAKLDKTCLQSQEVWTGTTYALSALMLALGLRNEGFNTAHGIYLQTYHESGYHFQTPEAWDSKGRFRALSYMRPLAIWSIHLINQRAKRKLKNV